MDVYLKKIELHGFKSFPEKIVIQFHRGITAIIGPNGCGKSNLVDALLWVMGEQRIKNLRGEDNQDLIFNGSSSKKPLGMTEVGMFISNKEEETYVARRFFRSGEGKYILNDKICRNRDVQDTLFSLGIGEKTYFIFEQGSVEKMVSLKAHERRILIEEAAGIAQYLEKKKETASKLVIAQQNLDSLDIILTDKGKRLKELKNQAQYVQRYRANKSQRSDYLKALLKKKYLSHKEEFDTIRSAMEKEITNESVLAKDISENEEKVLRFEQERWERERKLKADQQQLFQMNGAILNCQKEQEKAQQRSGFLTQRNAELKRLKEGGHVDVTTLEEKEQGIGREATQHGEHLRSHEEEARQWGEKLEAQNQKFTQAMDREQAQKKELFSVESEWAAINNQSQQHEKNLRRSENEAAGKKHLLQELETQVKSDEIGCLETRQTGLEAEWQKKDRRLQESEIKLETYRRELQEILERMGKQKLEIQYMQGQKERYEKLGGKIRSASAASKAAVHEGTLQDMIQADKSLHRLLENFYFDEMDAPILRRVEDALETQAAKSILWRESAESFPPEIRNEPGFLGFLQERFTFAKPELKACFKDGVVAQDLKSGLSIFGKYGVNVATENNEVITRDGMLVRNREQGILEVLDEIKESESRLATLRLALEKSEKELAERRSEENRLVADAKSRREESVALNKERIACQSQIDLLTKNQQICRERIRIHRAEIEALAVEEDKTRRLLVEIREKAGKLEKRRQELNAAKENLAEEIGRFRAEIAEVEKAKVNAEHGLALVREKIQSAGQFSQDLLSQKQKLIRQMQSADKDMASFSEEMASLNLRGKALAKEEEGHNRKKKEIESQIKDEEERLNTLEKQIKEHQGILTAKRTARDVVRQKKQESEIALTGLKKDLFQLEELSAQELSQELKDIEADGQLLQEPLETLEQQYEESTQKLNRMRENDRLNFSAEAEAEIVDKDFQFMQGQKEDVLKSIQDMHVAIEKIDTESKESFMKAFSAIRENFIANFRILFDGGDADLSLTSVENILESGLEIQAQPPGKRLQNIRLLSGGEKTLTSLAFLFSLFQYKPSPFCVFDEVDASLDEANIQRFLNFLIKLKEKTQFVIITHNFKTMEKADYIYGISMDEPGISKIYSMKMN